MENEEQQVDWWVNTQCERKKNSGQVQRGKVQCHGITKRAGKNLAFYPLGFTIQIL